MLLLALACASPGDSAPTAAAATVDTCVGLDAATVGIPFATTWCASCHSSALPSRFGAPEGLDLESLAGLRAQLSVLPGAVGEGRMPPGGGPSDAEITRFLAWVACGAPGEDVVFPVPAVAAAGRAAWEVEQRVDAGADGSLLFSVRRLGIGSTSALGTLVTEQYVVGEADAWLLTRTRFDEVGEVLYADTWSPPLQVFRDADAWVSATTRTRDEPAGTSTAAEEWQFTRDPDPDIDARMRQPGERLILGIEVNWGSEVSFYVSDERGIDGHRFEDRALGDAEGGALETRVLSFLPFNGVLPAFPLAVNPGQNAHLVQWEPE